MDEPTDFVTRFRVGDLVPPPYFSGVKPEGIEKKDFEDPFNTPAWIETCRYAARSLAIEKAGFLGNADRSRMDQALFYLRSPRLAARHLISGGCPGHLWPAVQMMRDLFLRNGKLSVLDIGGGYGDNFFQLLHALPREAVRALQYDVVDNEASCELGRRLFRSYRVRPAFVADHSAIRRTYDIVLVIGTLQYISGWREFLANIEKLGKRYLYIARSPISLHTKSYTTTQLVCPAIGPHAGRLLGATNINVVGLGDLRETMSGTSWRTCFEFVDVDYSAQFGRLPAPWRDVRYFTLGWQIP